MSTTNKHNQIPQDGLKGLSQNWKEDLRSGFIISLLALPLSLGIAAASNFPNPMYGVLTAVIGGIIVSLLSGSRLTIKGPAAGLIVINAGAVAAFGSGEQGWHLALGAIVVASVLQIVFGLLKFGKFSAIFPLSAVHGMLAAIGLIIISKQIHILLGVNPVDHYGKPLVEPFELIAELPRTFAHLALNLPMVIVGVVSLALVLLIPMIKNESLKKIPMPLIVLLVAIPLAHFLHLSNYKEGLVTFKGSFTDLLGWNVDFGGTAHMVTFIQYVVLFSIIGSLESLLTVKAMDMLDPFRRKSDYNKDLVAVGIGNALSGIFGGLPMISEVARSTANINNGAKTRWANFFHGLILLAYMLLLTSVVQLIPKAALAALLIGVGIKLAHPREFIQTLKIGKDQFAVFVTTIFFTLAVDLLAGIAVGMLLELVLLMFNGLKFNHILNSSTKVVHEGNNTLLKIEGEAVYTNFMGIQKRLDSIPQGQKLTIDLTRARLIDHTVMENLHHFRHDYEEQGGTLSFVGLENMKSFSEHELSAKKLVDILE